MHASVPKGLKILLIKKSPPTGLRGSVEPFQQSLTQPHKQPFDFSQSNDIDQNLDPI